MATIKTVLRPYKNYKNKAKSTLSGWIQINTRLDNLVDTNKPKLNELFVSDYSFAADDITIVTDAAISSDSLS
jgi:hypothetical protein